MVSRQLLLGLILVFVGCNGNSQNAFEGWEHLFQAKQHYIAYFISEEIEVDGIAGEQAWSKAAWTNEFADIEGYEKKKPDYSTRVKMLWDNQNLYLLAELEEPHIWAYYKEHDKIVYHENDFEIFIDPDGDTREYFEIEINAQNTVFDLFMTKPYRNAGIPLISWDVQNLKSAVEVDGTLNNPSDTDQKWTVEMAIPFRSLRLGVLTQAPQIGTTWKINFSRVQWQTEIINGNYVRKKDENENIIPENNWVWSPVGIVNMHYPERWGTLKFSKNESDRTNDPVTFSGEMKAMDYIWLLYYLQHDFRKNNDRFAASLSRLSPHKKPDEVAEVLMEATKSQFNIQLTTKAGGIVTINQDGKIKKSDEK
ncbi:MAG TPA: carbohydrate-binding family 9-like protein [Prolixibacteraceae bacterium]|nr:carbohydrate-binding family 9-like protein [Prolixibacteraceae bacterium]